MPLLGRRTATRRLRSLSAALLAFALTTVGCTVDNDQPERDGPTQTVTVLRPIDPSVSMTDKGASLYAGSEPQESPRPRYDVKATIEPATGRVSGELTAVVPAGSEPEAVFRFFAGIPELDAAARIDRVDVDGEAVDAGLDASILTVPLPDVHRDVATVRIRFGYALAEREPGGLAELLSGGGDLTAAEVGLLARQPDTMMLAHWMPLWVPPGRSADPVPNGFGDIGAFAAADISVTLDVPSGWTVVDSGVRTDHTDDGDRAVFVSEGAGMRDFAVALLREPATRTRALDGHLAGVTISATAAAAGADQLDSVLDETEAALRELSDAYGEYPWREFDVVAAPLAGSVGGMEWPGATWIEAGLFNGGIPGLGRLSSSLEELGLDEQDLSGLLDELGGAHDEELTLLLSSARAWTIAHEVAHSWWTVVVGNDSVAAPVVDEPLAQYASCLVVRVSLADGDAVCRTQIESGYEQMRRLDEKDGAADRATDEFASSLQYGGLVYSKAAAFYLALEERYGVDRVTSALRSLASSGAFRMLTADDVVAVLTSELGPGVAELWTRWIEESHGDADLGAPEPAPEPVDEP